MENSNSDNIINLTKPTRDYYRKYCNYGNAQPFSVAESPFPTNYHPPHHILSTILFPSGHRKSTSEVCAIAKRWISLSARLWSWNKLHPQLQITFHLFKSFSGRSKIILSSPSARLTNSSPSQNVWYRWRHWIGCYCRSIENMLYIREKMDRDLSQFREISTRGRR